MLLENLEVNIKIIEIIFKIKIDITTVNYNDVMSGYKCADNTSQNKCDMLANLLRYLTKYVEIGRCNLIY